MTQPLLDLMTRAALAAGDTILEVYDRPIDASEKADGSPVTIADELAEKIILEHLKETGIPVLAEESAAAGDIPELGEKFFVVDPLDGTKEFIKRNGEFTVNIALVEHGKPTHGVVTAPALDEGYAGGPDGAYSFTITDGKAGAPSPICVLRDGPMNVVASRSHGHEALGALCAEFNVVEDLSVGSSLKFCLLAKGTARLYPRFTPTCEWDTAAGQAVLEAAGGVVLTLDGKLLQYGKTEKRFLNPYFVAADDVELGRAAAHHMSALIGN